MVALISVSLVLSHQITAYTAIPRARRPVDRAVCLFTLQHFLALTAPVAHEGKARPG